MAPVVIHVGTDPLVIHIWTDPLVRAPDSDIWWEGAASQVSDLPTTTRDYQAHTRQGAARRPLVTPTEA